MSHKQFDYVLKNISNKLLSDHSIKFVRISYRGDKMNSLQDWYKLRNPFLIILRAIAFEMLYFWPPCKLKNNFYRLFGIKIGNQVSIANHVHFDFLFPELISIEDGVTIGTNSEISAHDFMQDHITLGRVKIRSMSLIGGYSVIAPGVIIGKDSIIGLRSFVKNDVPEKEIWAGTPAKKIGEISSKNKSDDIYYERY